MIYGYARVSTKKQKLERQIENIKTAAPDAVIITEEYTGTKMDRPNWNKLRRVLKSGDVIIFDEISRMSRNAAEGFETYKELYEAGVELRFLKDATLNTANFHQTAQLAMTGSEVDVILEGINKYLMILAEKQIQAAFETAEHEVDYLHQRTAEGVKRAQMNGKQVGRSAGTKLTTKKSLQAKELIKKHSKDFGGSLSDAEVQKLAGISRNSYYKYKGELKEEI